MQFHSIKRNHPNKISRQVGRGGTRGKTSGRGTKGQNARSGHKKRPELRDIIKTLPKMRGRGVNIFKSFQEKASPVNLEMIQKHFSAGDVVSPETLVMKGLVERFKGRYPRVKILGYVSEGASFGKKVSVEKCSVSLDAKAQIEKAGGSVTMK
jgi:large subunit ribosomal protein L15